MEFTRQITNAQKRSAVLKQKSVVRSPSAQNLIKRHDGRPGSETSSLVSDFSEDGEACSSHSEGESHAEKHTADRERYGEAELMYKKLRR